MRHHRLADLLFNRPLMISEQKLGAILQIMGPRFDLDLTGLPAQQAAEVSEEQRSRAGYQVRDGLAIIGVYGPLLHRRLASEYPSGGPTTYGEIRRAFDLALADDGVEGIVLDIDSPGGEVSGVFDLADHIYRSRDIKPSTGIPNEAAFSAGYLLASAAGRIVLPRTAQVGSVGVIATHADFSRMEDAAGITVTHVYAGARKADYSPHQPLGDEALSRLQASVDETYKLFVDTVARHRGMKAADVRATEAGFFEGRKAVAMMLADEVSAADKAIESARRGRSSRIISASGQAGAKKEVKRMDIQELREQYPDQIAQIEEQARQGMIAQAEADTARTEAVTAETSRVLGVVGAMVGEQGGSKITAAVTAGLNPEQVQKLGLSLATGSEAMGQMLDAITTAAPEGLKPAKQEQKKGASIDTAAIYADRRKAVAGK